MTDRACIDAIHAATGHAFSDAEADGLPSEDPDTVAKAVQAAAGCVLGAADEVMG